MTYDNSKPQNQNLSSATSWEDVVNGFQAIYVWKAETAKRNAPVKVIIEGMPFVRESVLMRSLFVGDQVRLDNSWSRQTGIVVGCIDGRVSVMLTEAGVKIFHVFIRTIKEVNGIRVEDDEAIDNMIRHVQKPDDVKAQAIMNA
jgi:hypothetical protein